MLAILKCKGISPCAISVHRLYRSIGHICLYAKSVCRLYQSIKWSQSTEPKNLLFFKKTGYAIPVYRLHGSVRYIGLYDIPVYRIYIEYIYWQIGYVGPCADLKHIPYNCQLKFPNFELSTETAYYLHCWGMRTDLKSRCFLSFADLAFEVFFWPIRGKKCSNQQLFGRGFRLNNGDPAGITFSISPPPPKSNIC